MPNMRFRFILTVLRRLILIEKVMMMGMAGSTFHANSVNVKCEADALVVVLRS